MIVADVFHGQPDEVLSPGGGSGCSEPPPCRFGVFFTFWWRIQQISLDSDMTSSSTGNLNVPHGWLASSMLEREGRWVLDLLEGVGKLHARTGGKMGPGPFGGCWCVYKQAHLARGRQLS